jgi:tripartite-type tricarboxylate transporter receptor subunit TctC
MIRRMARGQSLRYAWILKILNKPVISRGNAVYRSFRFAALLVAGFAALTAPAVAQNYPTQPIRIIVPTPPGGVADLLARAVAQGISANTGKTVIAEQRTGAGGVIAADFVSKAAPDGYTIYMGFHPTQSILVHL